MVASFLATFLLTDLPLPAFDSDDAAAAVVAKAAQWHGKKKAKEKWVQRNIEEKLSLNPFENSYL